MRTFVAGFFVALLCGVFAATAAAATEPRAHGNGATAFQDFSFTARGTPLDARGTVVAHIPFDEFGLEGPPLLVVGRVECLNVIPGAAGLGDRAILTGSVIQEQHIPEEFEGTIFEELLTFDRFYIHVEDNVPRQEPAGPNPDRWNGTFYNSEFAEFSTGFPAEQLEDCRNLLLTGNALVEGDIEVVPAGG
jgi:hypothetical protein